MSKKTKHRDCPALGRHDMLADLDAVWGWEEFPLSTDASARLAHRLADSPYAWEWCEPAGPAAITPAAPGRLLIGRVLRRDTTWRISALGRARLERLRELFLTELGAPDLQPVSQFQQNQAARMSLREPPADLARG